MGFHDDDARESMEEDENARENDAKEKPRKRCESEGGKQEHDDFVHKTRKISLEPTATRIGIHGKFQHFRLDHNRVWGWNVQMSVA